MVPEVIQWTRKTGRFGNLYWSFYLRRFPYGWAYNTILECYPILGVIIMPPQKGYEDQVVVNKVIHINEMQLFNKPPFNICRGGFLFL